MLTDGRLSHQVAALGRTFTCLLVPSAQLTRRKKGKLMGNSQTQPTYSLGDLLFQVANCEFVSRENSRVAERMEAKGDPRSLASARRHPSTDGARCLIGCPALSESNCSAMKGTGPG